MTPTGEGAAGENRRSVDTDERADRLVDLLDDPHCRYLLSYLQDEDDPVQVDEAVRYVVAQLTDTPVDEISAEVERRVQTWFYHGQLPALDEFGLIDFDPDSGTVALADDATN